MSDNIELTVTSRVTSKRVQKHHRSQFSQSNSLSFPTTMSSPPRSLSVSASREATTTPLSMVSDVSEPSEANTTNNNQHPHGSSKSNSNKDVNTKLPAAQRDSQQPQSTIQMMTMDHEGDRIWRPPTPQQKQQLLEEHQKQQQHQSTTPSPSREMSEQGEIVQDVDPSWWKRGVQRLLTRSNNNDTETRRNDAPGDVEELGYASLNDGYGNVDSASPSRTPQDDPPPSHSNTSSPSRAFVAASSLVSTPKRKTRGTNGSLRTSLLQEAQQPSPPADALRRGGGDSSLSLSSSLSNMPPSRSPEDSIHEDCSFFFRDEDAAEEAHGARKAKRGFRALRQHEHRTDFSYKDAVDVLAPTFLNQYKTRYEQLNQDFDEVDAGPSNPCLGLEADDANSEVPSEIVRTQTAIHSSLFYQHQGRVLMRLPVDHVRLFMDPDLEAGVLSVEQCRAAETDNQYKEGDDRPQLRYVMTVDDNLYKRIVTEMSDSLVKPYCGIGRCGNGKEKADIWIACAILVVVLTVFFINVLIWGPHQ